MRTEAAKLGDYPPRIRRAIERSKLMPGMTREQVLISVGYPVSSENPKQVITADQQTSNLVEMD